MRAIVDVTVLPVVAHAVYFIECGEDIAIEFCQSPDVAMPDRRAAQTMTRAVLLMGFDGGDQPPIIATTKSIMTRRT